jgi:Heat induced stress protein YflT
MATSVIGLFDSFDASHDAVEALINGGFKREDISVVAQDADNTDALSNEVGVNTNEAAATGAVSGTVVGGALGLLVGAGLLLIPGIGPVLAAGPIAAAIGTATATVGAAALGAGVGAATGGLAGYLIDEGVPAETAEYYAEGVRRGGRLVSVRAADNDIARAHNIMQQYGAVDIEDRVADWRDSGWTGSDSMDTIRSSQSVVAPSASTGYPPAIGTPPNASVNPDMNKGRDFEFYEPNFRDHFRTSFGATGLNYDTYLPAYRYGYDRANDPIYRDRDWDSVEQDLRGDWGRQNHGSWEEFKEGVRYAWNRARNAVS